MSINQSHPEDQGDQCLSSLQGEVENFILRMATEFPQRREQLVFLINNYDMMLSVITVRWFLELVPMPFFVVPDRLSLNLLAYGWD